MFWRGSAFSQPSPLETILDKQNFTLEEVLDEDNLIQEVKALNGRLIDFLKRRETLAALLGHITSPPPAGEEGPGEGSEEAQKAGARWPFTACEVLCCEVDALFSALLEDAGLMGQLFAFLDRPPPLDTCRAGYFARVVASLARRRAAEVLAYLQAHAALLTRLVAHLQTAAIAEVIMKVVGADEPFASGAGMNEAQLIWLNDTASLSHSQRGWLADTPLMGELLGGLAPGLSPDVHRNAAATLSAIARRSHMTPLCRGFLEDGYLPRLLDFAFGQEPSNLEAVEVVLALLQPRALVEAVAASSAKGPFAQLDAATALDDQVKAALVQGLQDCMPRVVALLEGAQVAEERLPLQYGLLAPPLGSARLKVVELLAALLRLGSPEATVGVTRAGAVPRCLELVRAYPFNNLLHHQVAALLAVSLELGPDELLQHLLGECRLLSWLTELPEEVVPQPRGEAPAPGGAPGGAAPPSAAPASAAAPAATKGPRPPLPLRAGYMGHVTLLGNKLVELRERRPALAAALQADPGWGAWVETKLQVRNGVENVEAWACGRGAVRAGVAGFEAALEGVTYGEEVVEADEGREGALGQAHRYPPYEKAFDDEDGEGDGPQRAPPPPFPGPSPHARYGEAGIEEGDDVEFLDAAAALQNLRLTRPLGDASEGGPAIMPLAASSGAMLFASGSSDSSDSDEEEEEAQARGHAPGDPLGAQAAGPRGGALPQGDLDEDSAVTTGSSDEEGEGEASPSTSPQGAAGGSHTPQPQAPARPDAWQAFGGDSSLISDGEGVAAGDTQPDTGWADFESSFPEPEGARPAPQQAALPSPQAQPQAEAGAGGAGGGLAGSQEEGQPPVNPFESSAGFPPGEDPEARGPAPEPTAAIPMGPPARSAPRGLPQGPGAPPALPLHSPPIPIPTSASARGGFAGAGAAPGGPPAPPEGYLQPSLLLDAAQEDEFGALKYWRPKPALIGEGLGEGPGPGAAASEQGPATGAGALPRASPEGTGRGAGGAKGKGGVREEGEPRGHPLPEAGMELEEEEGHEQHAGAKGAEHGGEEDEGERVGLLSKSLSGSTGG